MARRFSSREPAFGSDSFLDVTANLVGVLIILIVLVGLRVAKTPPRSAAVDAEVEQRLGAIRGSIDSLTVQRLELGQLHHTLSQDLSAKRAALTGMVAAADKPAAEIHTIAGQLQAEQNERNAQDAEILAAQARLVSLQKELDQTEASPAPARELDHRSPLSQRVESDEIYLELQAGDVSFIDREALMERLRTKAKTMEAELRSRGRATSEVGPVGNFRLRFTLDREDVPFTQSLIYGTGSFRPRLVEWNFIPNKVPRGEPVATAVQPNSQLDHILLRHSPNKYAVTIWTYADSFSSFRQLRDHLAERGYTVAARPLPAGILVGGSIFGTRSFAQ